MKSLLIPLVVPVLLVAQQPKPTLGTVTDEVRKAASESAASAVAAQKSRDDSAASAAAAAKKASVEADLRAQVAALRAQIAARQSNDELVRLQAARDARLQRVEDVLKSTETDKRVALEEAERQKQISDAKSDANWIDIKRAGYGVLSASILMVLGALVKMFTDKKHHAQEERKIDLIHVSTMKIHDLVNSSMTERMESELATLRLFLISSQELLVARKHAGAEITQESLDMLVETKLKITQLTEQVKSRLKNQNAQLREEETL